jgi:hypothetical protein
MFSADEAEDNMSEVDYAYAVQEKLVSKYGSEYGLTPALVGRIQDGTASEHDYNTYTEHSPKLVDRFKKDLATMDMNNISRDDAEIAVGLIAANNATFDRDETYAKVVTPNGVSRMLQNGQPTMQGFSAMGRYSADLSPQQTISQFGLNYEHNGTKPYLVKDGDNDVAQTFVYSMEAPISGELRARSKIPVDPRLMQAAERIANDPDTPGHDLMKRAAKEIANSDVCVIAARDDGTDTSALVSEYKAKGFKAEGALGGPYTGNSVPRFGTVGDFKTGYADTIQERTLGNAPVECPPGTAIYIKVPRPDAPDDPSVPHGSVKVKLAEWNGKSWDKVATDEEIEAAHQLACAGKSPEVQAQIRARLITVESLNAQHAAGAAKEGLGTPLPDAAKKKIEEHETKAKREVLTDLTGDAMVAAAAVKFKKKTKQQDDQDAKKKAKKRKDAEEDEEEKDKEGEDDGQDEQDQKGSESGSESGDD